MNNTGDFAHEKDVQLKAFTLKVMKASTIVNSYTTRFCHIEEHEAQAKALLLR